MCFVRWMKDWVKLAAVAAVLAAVSMAVTPEETQAQGIQTLPTVTVTATPPPVDRSKGYFGGATPRQFEKPAGRQMVDIASVGGKVDVNAILGCSGLDIGAAIENTLNVGNLADEFTSYLKTSLAQSALTLLYQSPSLNAVLDGLRAVGHARVSMTQAQCSATEAFVDSRTQEVRNEALQLCHSREENNPQCSKPEKLAGYIRELMGIDKDGNRLEGRAGRWNGCLYDHMCEGDGNCAWSTFVPNFCYDVGSGEGKTAEPMLSPQEAFDGAEHAAMMVMEERLEKACGVIDEKGYTNALRDLETSWNSGNSQNAAPAPAAEGGAAEGSTAEGGAAESGGEQSADASATAIAEYAKYFGKESCVDPDTQLVYSDVKKLLDQASSVNKDADGNEVNAFTGGAQLNFDDMQKIIVNTVKCSLGRKIHPHVDVNMCMLPQAEKRAMQQSISQAVAAESTINVFNAIIFKLSEMLATQGFSTDGGMNSAVRDQVVLLIDQVKNMRDAMSTTLSSYRDVSERVAAMNKYVAAQQEKLDARVRGDILRAQSSLGNQSR